MSVRAGLRFRCFARYPFASVTPRTTRFLSTSTSQITEPIKHQGWWQRVPPRSRKVGLVIGGVGTATIGVLLMNHKEGDHFQDLRDNRALSTVPLSKLVSGWM